MTDKPFRYSTLAVAVASSLLLTACATTGMKSADAGERISERGGAISARGAAWTDGQHDKQKGERLVARSTSRTADGEKKLKRARENAAEAERDIQYAQADQIKGEQMIAEGAAQMARAETAYAAIRNGPAAVAPE